MTQQRRLLKKIIDSSDKHLTAEEIYAIAKQQMPEIAMATVYRNLRLMTDCGEIRRVKMYQGADFFDRTVMHHDHALCKLCGEIYDLPGHLKHTLEQALGYEIDAYDLNIYYICPNCKIKIEGEEER